MTFSTLETLATKVLGQDVGGRGYVGVLLRGVLGAEEASLTVCA